MKSVTVPHLRIPSLKIPQKSTISRSNDFFLFLFFFFFSFKRSFRFSFFEFLAVQGSPFGRRKRNLFASCGSRFVRIHGSQRTRMFLEDDRHSRSIRTKDGPHVCFPRCFHQPELRRQIVHLFRLKRCRIYKTPSTCITR